MSKKGLFILITTAVFLLQLIQNKPVQAKQSRQLSAADREKLLIQACSIFPDYKLPDRFRTTGVATQPPIRCGTMILEQVRQNLQYFSKDEQQLLKQLLQRPDLPESYLSPSARFKIHYTLSGTDAVAGADDNGDGVPDFVEAVALAFEKSFAIQVNQMGYKVYPDDMGEDGPEYDIYMEDLGSQFYGFTQGELSISETPENDYASYIVIDNDFNNGHFSRGLAGAEVTAAHEFFHALQFGYRTFANEDEKFYYESCAVWMEDVVFDDINDYYQYLPLYFANTQTPFNEFTFRSFGQALWDLFLTKKYHNADMIRRSWELIGDGDSPIEAIDGSLTEIGSSFATEFTDFARWNYFTGTRADSVHFYKESRAYNEIAVRGTFELGTFNSVADVSNSLTHSYYKFTTLIAGAYSISGELETPANWRFAAIIITPEADTTFQTFNLIRGQNFDFLPTGSEIIIIPINIQIDEMPGVSSTELSFSFEIQQSSLEFPVTDGIFQIYPSPFVVGRHNRMFIDFVPVEEPELELRIFSSDGRLIKKANFASDPGFISRSTYIWDGINNEGETVPAGIYVVQLKQHNLIDTRKFAVVR